MYKECLYNVYQAFADSLLIEQKMRMTNFNYEGAKTFFAKFDDICQQSFLNCFSNFNGYSLPILWTTYFTNYLNGLKRFLCNNGPSFCRIMISILTTMVSI